MDLPELFPCCYSNHIPGFWRRDPELYSGQPDLPPISAISNLLINELNQIEKHVILVFDDYHLIENQAIHNLLQELMIYPARSIHMVLGTRMDPPLPLATLRADNQVTEIRAQDLRF